MADESAQSALGLRPDEEAVYRALVARSSATPDQLAKALGSSPPAVSTVLAVLETDGLAVRSGGARPRYAASPPAVAFGPLINSRRDALHEAEAAMAELAERYRDAAASRAARDVIEVVTGRGPVRHRFEQLQLAAERDLQVFVTANPVAVERSEAKSAEEQSARRGVNYRAVIEREILDQGGIRADIADSLAAGVQLRVAERVPLKMIIADGSVGMVPLATASAVPSAVLVHGSGLLDALMALFESVWVKAWPLHVTGTAVEAEPTASGPDDIDKSILALLLAGMTDRSIAGQLDLSMRTVQRRVRAMMDLAGVRTRLQLGWHAARAGWV